MSAAYVPGIDGLRALAVLLVVCFHLRPGALSGGFIGVDVFFVISGYVVTGSLLHQNTQGLWSFLGNFYGRRIRRILPALFVCLCVTAIFFTLFVPKAWLSELIHDTGLAAFLGLSNFALLAGDDGYFAPRSELNPFTHTWSLAVEEQFYLVYPVLLWLCVWARGRKLALSEVWVIAALSAVSLAWCAWATLHRPGHAYFMLASRFWELAAGGLLSLTRTSWLGSGLHRRYATPVLLLGLGLIGVSAWVVSPGSFPFPGALPAVVGSLCVIWGVTDPAPRKSWALGVLASRPMVWMGLRSYSLYLWHWPVFTAFRWTAGLDAVWAAALAVVVTALLTELSFRCVEKPILRSPAMALLPARSVIAVGLLAVGAGWLASRQLYALQPEFSLSVVMQRERDWYPHPDWRSEPQGPDLCKVAFSSRRQAEGGRIQEFAPQDCATAPPSSGRVFVVGDSHASAYRRMLHLFVAKTGVPVTLIPEGGCPLAALFEPKSARRERCAAFDRFAMQHLAATARPGDVVFLAALRTRRWDTAPASDTKPAPTDAAAMAAAYAEAQADLRALEQLGLKVIIDAPKPVFKAPAFRCSDWFNRHNPVCEGELSVARDVMEERRRDVLQSLRRLQTEHAGLWVWDPMAVLCGASLCEATPGGRPYFFDNDHLSGLANERLLPSFQAIVQVALGGQGGS